MEKYLGVFSIDYISNDFTPKNINLFVCKNCDFTSSNKKEFNKQLDEEQESELETELKQEYKTLN